MASPPAADARLSQSSLGKETPNKVATLVARMMSIPSKGRAAGTANNANSGKPDLRGTKSHSCTGWALPRTWGLLWVNIGRKNPSKIRATPARLTSAPMRGEDEEDGIANLFLLAVSRVR